MIRQFYFWVYAQGNENRILKKYYALSCLLQHYSQLPRYGNELSVHQWMKRYGNCGTYTQWILFSEKRGYPAICKNMDGHCAYYAR